MSFVKQNKNIVLNLQLLKNFIDINNVYVNYIINFIVIFFIR